ncbi:FxsA family protein [Vreelandella utahensis]|uniref:FxsA family protein n=1 Tax=Vreelandella halophila TaxID=86177 RepID=UPI00098526A6|nr:FxsA family protein [Halomonas utahensis]
MPVFLIAFIIIPIIEMVILIEVGGLIGALPTVGLVLLTAVIGAAMLRQQGAATLLRANQRMASGELPAREMAEGLLLAVGGALLLTPGFVTDAVGFACLIPFTRRWLSGYVVNRMVFSGGASMGGHYEYHQYSQSRDRGPRRDAHGNIIIEGEFEQEQQGREPEDPDRLDRR